MIVIEGGAVATVDAVGHGTPRRPRGRRRRPDRSGRSGAPHPRCPDPVRHVDATGCLVTPGLVNTHHHLYQWATRGLAQQQNLFGWLTELYPIWAGIDEEVVGAAAAAGLGWLALSGCTTSTDHHYVFPRGRGDLFAATIDAAAAVGMRFHPARGSMDLGASAGGLPPDDLVEKTDEALAATQEAIDRFHDPSPGVDGAGRGRAVLAVLGHPGPDARVRRRWRAPPAYGCTPTSPRRSDESSYCLREHGCTPVEYAERLGFLGDDVWLAHGVHCSAAEIARLGETRHRRGALPKLQRPARRRHRAGTGSARRPRAGGSWRRRRRVAGGRTARRRAAPGALRGAAARRPGGADRARGARRWAPSAARGALAGRTNSARWSRASSPTWPYGGWTDWATTGIDDPVAALVLGPPAVVELLLVGGVPIVERGALVRVREADLTGRIRVAARRLAGAVAA